MSTDGMGCRDECVVSAADSHISAKHADPFPPVETGLRRPLVPRVAVFLCTYQGQNYLAEQLDSICAQTHPNWLVVASDDGSQDETLAILESYQHRLGADRLIVCSGPAEGYAANFLSLAHEASIGADYYAYSDQDDTWKPDKLSRALAWLETVPANIPGLYCSRTLYISEHGRDVGLSTLFCKPPGFRNALVQSVAGGNTMVFNQAARDLLAKTPKGIEIVAHDWWLYMLVTGCGGRVYYDPYPGVRYRQHGSNMAGQNVTFSARMVRVKELLAGRFKKWNEINVKALGVLRDVLTEENRMVLDVFSHARKQPLVPRLVNLVRSGVYRQTLLGNVGLFVAAFFDKL